jgi:hypothetical protein
VGTALVVAGALGGAVGATIHGMTTLTLLHQRALGQHHADPMEGVVAAGIWLWGLWALVGLVLVVGHVLLLREVAAGRSALPRATLVFNPLTLTVALVAISLPVDMLSGTLAPAAPNLAHAIFFAWVASKAATR